MNVEVIVPFAGTDPARLRALEWLGGRCPYRLTVALGGEPWSKGACLWPAIRTSTADILVIHDADVWTDGLPSAILSVMDGRSWAIPHRTVYRLSHDGTAAYMTSGEVTPPFDRPPYEGMAGGGIVVAQRDVLLDVPMDPRFVGWGQDDESWAMALWCLYGPPWRGEGDLVHLWHPPAPRLDRRVGNQVGWLLRDRYAHARRNPELMRELVAETHAALPDQRRILNA